MRIDGIETRTLWWERGVLRMINQPLLPHKVEIVDLPTFRESAVAISDMTVRGAPAIGATGAFGVAQAAIEAPDAGFHDFVAAAANVLRATRPTAQNLFTGINYVLAAIAAEGDSIAHARSAALAAAQKFADDDAANCRRIGELGAPIVAAHPRVSTHCNAGWLACVDWGTALSPIYVASRGGAKPFVYVDETRPRQQGSQLTAFELGHEGVDHAVIADNATGHYLKAGAIDMVIVGSDRIARNGDVANKIGTYTSALAAKAAGVPFYVAAPVTTIAPQTATGADIPIEERSGDEVLYVWGWSDDGRFIRVRTAPRTSSAKNPAFDVTPAALVTGIITEKGIIPATYEGISSVL